MRQIPVFFYGLFMDPTFLEGELGRPPRMRLVRADGYRLMLSRRAYLEPEQGAVVWGMLADLTWGEVDALYRKYGLLDYVPEPLLCETTDGGGEPALMMNLPSASPGDPRDTGDYRAELVKVLTKVGAPSDYIARMTDAVGG